MVDILENKSNQLTGSSDPVSKSSDERISRRDALFQTVRMVKTTQILETEYEGLNTHALSNLENSILVFTPEGVRMVNTCSNKYRLVPIKDILLQFEENLDPLFDYDAVYRHSEYCRFFVDYIIKKPTEMTANDKIAPRIRIQHSYSGDVKYEVKFGFYRLICSNGMYATDFERKVFTKHTKSRLSEELNRTTDIIVEFLDQADEYSKPFEIMASKPILSWEDRLNTAIEHTGFPKNLRDQISQRANIEIKQNNLEKTDWLLYCAMNYQLNHNYEDLRMQEWHRQKMDEKVINFFLN